MVVPVTVLSNLIFTKPESTTIMQVQYSIWITNNQFHHIQVFATYQRIELRLGRVKKYSKTWLRIRNGRVCFILHLYTHHLTELYPRNGHRSLCNIRRQHEFSLSVWTGLKNFELFVRWHGRIQWVDHKIVEV